MPWDDDTKTVVREILSDPSLPVGTLVAGAGDYPGGGGRRLTALREAHDHVISRRLVGAAHTTAAAASVRAEVEQVDPALAATLYWHLVIVPVLAELPPSKARNAALGDVTRGELLTWATAVREWHWHSGAAPTAEAPTGRVDGIVDVDEYPGLYDSIILWESGSRQLAVIPTHRDGLSWVPSPPDPVTRAGHWIVRLDRVSIHVDELIPLDTHPRELATWQAGVRR